MPEILKIQIPKIINDYPSVGELKNFASNYTENQWAELCFNSEFMKVIIEEKNLAKTKNLANSILGVNEEKQKKKQDGGDDNKELVNAS